MIIEGVDYSDEVLTDGIQITTSPKFNSTVDLDFYNHVSNVVMKRNITVNFGCVSGSMIDKLESDISKSNVIIQTNEGEKVYYNVTLSRSASYISDGELYWNSVTLTGVEV